MPVVDPDYWSDLLRHTLACYDEALLRQVAARLVKPRNQWPVEDLIERGWATTTNPAVIDRRLQELTPAARQVLALIGHSRQPCWQLGNLVEMAIALGQTDGLQPVLALLEAGLLYPRLDAVCTARNATAVPIGRSRASSNGWPRRVRRACSSLPIRKSPPAPSAKTSACPTSAPRSKRQPRRASVRP